MIVLLLIWNIIFIVFFSLIGMRFLSFIPILVGLLLFLSMSNQHTEQALSAGEMKSFFLRNAFSFAWACVMLGGWGLAKILGGDVRYISLWLVGINILIWLLAYVVEYEDGKEMFHMGYYMASFLFFGSIMHFGFDLVRQVLIAWIAMTMAIYASIIFVGSALGKKVAYSMNYPLFISFVLCILFLAYQLTRDDAILSLVMSQIVLMILYVVIYGVNWYHKRLHIPEITPSHGVLKDILSGKSLYEEHSPLWNLPIKSSLVHEAWNFIHKLNHPTKFIIGFFNVGLILAQVIGFFWLMGNYDMVMHEILLWFGIVAFFVNYLLLKEIDFPHTMQRALSFILINFGIYLTIINLFGFDPVYIVGVGIMWSLLNSMVMFHTGGLARKGILQDEDYNYRIGANMLTMLVNMYFLFMLPLSLELRFFLTLIYFGLQLFLTLYNMRLTKNLHF